MRLTRRVRRAISKPRHPPENRLGRPPPAGRAARLRWAFSRQAVPCPDVSPPFRQVTRKMMKKVLAALAVVVIVGALAWEFSPKFQELRSGHETRPTLTTKQPGPVAPPVLQSLNPVLSRVSPAVVNVSVEGTAQAPANPLLQDPFFRHFFGNPPPQQQERHTKSVGSGVIIDARNGYILTNNHVIADADHIQVTLTDRRELDATLVGTDPEIDIAVLKVDAHDLTAMPIGDSDKLKIGDFVIALGNPFGIGQAATLGIVSALGRSGLGIEGYEDFIQTDASINPGNSGGALIDQTGQLVGINTAILSGSGGNIGIGFAIPADMAIRTARQIIKYGGVQRGQIGVMIQDLTPELADAMGIDTNDGALVSDVVPGSPAEKAGIKAGDVITAIDGKSVTGGADLRNHVGLMRPGREVTLDIYRAGNKTSVTLKLGEQTASAASGSVSERFRGLSLGPIPDDDPLSGEVKGVYVQSVDPGSEAARSGLQEGDIIVGANRQPVTDMDDLKQAAAAVKGHPLLLQVRRGDASIFLAMR
ncbi:MAG: Do family serine endopeptidase [Alphaproteobacteria bacterium]|nr:Do family serine endopeptidase [Alphaproteobacteria bacterium]